MPELTPRMAQAKQFIAAHTAQNGHAPTCQEIAAGMGMKSKSGVHRLIEGLEERGHISRLPGRSRSVSVTEPGLIMLRADVMDRLRKYANEEGTSPQALANEMLAELLGIEDGGVTT